MKKAVFFTGGKKMKKKYKLVMIVVLILIVIGIIAIFTFNQEKSSLKIEIIKYNNTGLGITNKIKVTSKKDKKKIQESIEEIKLVPEREMVDLSIMRQIEINYNDTVTIGIQEGQEYYCWYEDKNKSGLAYLPTKLYERVMEIE